MGIPAESTWPPIGLGDLSHVDWGVVGSQLPLILGAMLVALIGVVLHAGAIELVTGVEIDLNREFRAEGALMPGGRHRRQRAGLQHLARLPHQPRDSRRHAADGRGRGPSSSA